MISLVCSLHADYDYQRKASTFDELILQPILQIRYFLNILLFQRLKVQHSYLKQDFVVSEIVRN